MGDVSINAPSYNAETLGGFPMSHFAQNIPAWYSGEIKELVTNASSGPVFIQNTVSGMPVDNTYWFGEIHASSSHRLIRVYKVGQSMNCYTMFYNNGTKYWSGWMNRESTNPNYVDNSDFAINQRGQTEYTSVGYTVDRWFISANDVIKVIPETGGISITALKSASGYYLAQKTEKHLGAGWYTISAFVDSVSDGTSFVVRVRTVSSDDGSTYKRSLYTTATSAGLRLAYFKINDDEEIDQVSIGWIGTAAVGSTIKFKWVKLEEGMIASTYEVPNPATELLKCQRYYQRLHGSYCGIGDGYFRTTNSTHTSIPIQPMRTKPTVTINGSVYITAADHDAESGFVSTSILSTPAYSEGLSSISVAFSFEGTAVKGQGCRAQFRDSDSYIELSAEP